MTRGLLLFAHGARDPRWAEPFDAVAERIRASAPELRVELAYLEFMTPSLSEAACRLATDGCLVVDSHQRTNVPGLFAAGDVVKGLDQISHAMGEGGVAATAIRNYLAELKPLRR